MHLFKPKTTQSAPQDKLLNKSLFALTNSRRYIVSDPIDQQIII